MTIILQWRSLMSNLQNGIALFQSGEYSQAFEILLPFAEEGNAEAQSVIGCIYELGLGKDININNAIYWYEKSVAQDHIIALNNLANIFMYRDQECFIDTNKAVNLYRKAAELGLAPSQYMIGKIYLEGIGVDVDETEAIKWLKLASENDFEPARGHQATIIGHHKTLRGLHPAIGGENPKCRDERSTCDNAGRDEMHFLAYT